MADENARKAAIKRASERVRSGSNVRRAPGVIAFRAEKPRAQAQGLVPIVRKKAP
jgi:hypothetical protein